MKKKIILISGAIALVVIFGLLLERLILPKMNKIRDDCQALSKYSGDMAQFRWDIIYYLDDYYDEHKCYPNDIDVNTFDTFDNPDYTKNFERVTYHSDGHSYKLTFIERHYIGVNLDEKAEGVIVVCGVNGETMDPESYVIDKKTGKRVKE